MKGRRVRSAARVYRVQQTYAFVVIPSWLQGAVLVRVKTQELLAVTGLPRNELLGAELTVRVFLDALGESDLRPENWQLARTWGSADEALESRGWPATA